MASQPSATQFVLICGHHTLALPHGQPTVTPTTKINYIFDRTPCNLCRNAPPSPSSLVRQPTPVDLQRVEMLHTAFTDTLNKLNENFVTFDTQIRSRFSETTLVSYSLDNFVKALLLSQSSESRTRRLETQYHFSRFHDLIGKCKYFGSLTAQTEGQTDRAHAVFFGFCRNEALKLYLPFKRGALEVGRVIQLLQEAGSEFNRVLRWLDGVETEVSPEADEEKDEVIAEGDLCTGGAELRFGAAAHSDGYKEGEQVEGPDRETARISNRTLWAKTLLIVQDSPP